MQINFKRLKILVCFYLRRWEDKKSEWRRESLQNMHEGALILLIWIIQFQSIEQVTNICKKAQRSTDACLANFHKHAGFYYHTKQHPTSGSASSVNLPCSGKVYVTQKKASKIKQEGKKTVLGLCYTFHYFKQIVRKLCLLVLGNNCMQFKNMQSNFYLKSNEILLRI